MNATTEKAIEELKQIACDGLIDGMIQTAELDKWIAAAVQSAILAEREACAKIIEFQLSAFEEGDRKPGNVADCVALALESSRDQIRARSNAPQCSLCEKGWPIEDGWHMPSQSRGMIEAKRCPNTPPSENKGPGLSKPSLATLSHAEHLED